MSCHQPYHSNYDHQFSDCSQSESASFSSQHSFASVPSLTSRAHQQPNNFSNIHYHCLTTLKGHSSYVSSLTLAGNFLYMGSSDREIRAWDCNSPLNSELDQEIINSNIIAAGKGAVKSLVVLDDKLISAHQDHKIRVWKINNQEYDQQKYTRLATLPTFGDRAIKMLMPGNHVQIRRHKTSTWVHHVDTVSALALTKDETLLYSASWDRTIKIWRTSDFKCLESVTNAHDDAINAMALSSDGHVYTGSADNKIKVWRKIPGEKKLSLVETLEKHKSGINALALNTEGSFLYTGASDRSILVWEKDNEDGNMVVIGALRGHTKSILCIAVVSDLVCSGSADRTIRIWSGIDRNYSCLAVLEGHKGPVKCLTATTDQYNSSDNSYLIYSGGLDCDIKVWQLFVPLL